MTVQFVVRRSDSSTPLLDVAEAASLRAFTLFISTRTSPTAKPNSAPRRATWMAYALATRVFVGTHPVFTHVPPNLWRSIIATVLPAPANRRASDGPAWPVPMMIASKCFISVNSVFIIAPISPTFITPESRRGIYRTNVLTTTKVWIGHIGTEWRVLYPTGAIDKAREANRN